MIRLLKEISQEDNILGDFCTDLLDDSRFRVLKTKKEKIDYISGLYGWHCSEVDEAILEILGILGDSYSLKKLKVINDRIKGLEEDDDEEEEYDIPSGLNPFQHELYMHLIEWKRRNITTEKALDKYGYEKNDAFLPEWARDKFPHIYPDIVKDLKKHKEKFDFKFHKFFNHMASSQAANINLFLPILLSKKANDILRLVKTDFNKLATDKLDQGFRIEFWDGNSKDEKGLLADHSPVAGTDADIAIAYYDKMGDLCLWLIEHKLTEKEFTECGGYKSKGRDKEKHICEKSFDEILENKDLCYYHNVKNYKYWDLTEKNLSIFANHSYIKSCPFKGGMNQLWRNQLLGLAIENTGEYKDVYFSVVKHPDNYHLVQTIINYNDVIANNQKFSYFDSSELINAASKIKNSDLNNWIEWYKYLYNIVD